MAKKRTTTKSTNRRTQKKATPKAAGIRITKGRSKQIQAIAEALAEISPATTRGNGFCVYKVALDHGDKKLWKDKGNKKKSITHYLEELFRKALERFEKKIQDATGEHEIGKTLMGKTFNKESPKIAINNGTEGNDSSEREGFMHLTLGAMMGMRNIYSHGDTATMEPMEAFERLCFVSLLFKRIDAALETPATRACSAT